MARPSKVDDALPQPPEVAPRAARIAQRLISPVERFLHVEASSGVVLMLAALAAMLIASSRWGAAFHHLLEAPLSFGIGSQNVEKPIHFWINDGLMTIFFFVVGLEIRRELHDGELSNARRAALPAAAALGGMIVPALLYLVIAGEGDRAGWGVPMATDIAFAVGILALLGKRVPPALRVLLLALAIIDDIGGIVVIAIFYSGPLVLSGFAIVAGGMIAIVVMQGIAVRRPALYILPAMAIWIGFLRAGIHPTLAGIVVGLLTPARPWLGAGGFVKLARRAADKVEHELASGEAIDAHRIAHETERIDLARREALAPAVRLQILLHPFVAFIVMPLFALANAGVSLGDAGVRSTPLTIGICVALVLGKPLGIVSACALAVSTKVATLPKAIGWPEIAVLGMVAGIGFTMALFIASLAFPEGAKLEEAKAAILVASGLAITLGLVVGRIALRPRSAGDVATAEEAERSDDV